MTLTQHGKNSQKGYPRVALTMPCAPADDTRKLGISGNKRRKEAQGGKVTGVLGPSRYLGTAGGQRLSSERRGSESVSAVASTNTYRQ